MEDLFTSSLQAKWLGGFANNLVKDISASLNDTPEAFDPKTIVQRMADLLKEESQASEADSEPMQIYSLFYESLEELKTDENFTALMAQYNDAMEGKINILTIGMNDIILLALQPMTNVKIAVAKK